MKIVLISLIFLGILIPLSVFADSQIITLCDSKKCPFISQNEGNQITITCNDNPVNCKIIYANSAGLTKTYTNQLVISEDAKITWLPKNVVEIDTSVGTSDWWSIFIDFNTMKLKQIESVFAANKNLNQPVAVYRSGENEVSVSPIFNLSKKFNISENFATDPAVSVQMPSTHFDKKGNLVLVYWAAPKGKTTTKVIPIDYKKLGIK